MSRSTDRAHRDDGFTLIEVIVALGVIMVVVTALLPQMVAGIRSVTVADGSTALKAAVQQQVERMRSMSFHLPVESDPAATDLLDTYFPSTSSVPGQTPSCGGVGSYQLPTAGWTGYVDTGVRCPYEPATGGFFRTVAAAPAPADSIQLVVDVQFVDAGTFAAPGSSPVTPASYQSNASPPTPGVTVMVTGLRPAGDRVQALTLVTQIAEREPEATQVKSELEVTALHVESTDESHASLTLDAGVVSLAGALDSASTASASVAGVVGRLSTGDPGTSEVVYGAVRNAAAPTATSIVPLEGAAHAGADCSLFCFGRSSVVTTAGVVTSDQARPNAGSSADPLQAALVNDDAALLTFDNVSTPSLRRVGTAPPVRLLAGTTPGTASATSCLTSSTDDRIVTAGAFLTTEQHGTPTPDAEACGRTRSATVAVMPTSWAPDGVVQVTLHQSMVSCRVEAGVGAVDGPALEVDLEVYDGVDSGGNVKYRPVDAQTLPDVASVALPDHGDLSSFVQSWTYDLGTSGAVGSHATVDMPGFTIRTVPTRQLADHSGPDPDSFVSLTLGAGSCSVLDAR